MWGEGKERAPVKETEKDQPCYEKNQVAMGWDAGGG